MNAIPRTFVLSAAANPSAIARPIGTDTIV